MDRYQIARGLKKPEEPVQDNVQTFGFDDDLKVKEIRRSRRRRREYFNPNPGEPARVGILYEDPKKILTGTHAHFCKTYFLCKSDQGHREVCCRYSKRFYRTACTLIVYQNVRQDLAALTSSSTYQLLPWVFGTTVYDMLKKIHEHFPVFKHDLIIKRSHGTLKTYDMQPLGISLWQASTPQIKDKIITEVRPLLDNMKDCIGADLSPDEIRDLIAESQAEQRALVNPVAALRRAANPYDAGAPRRQNPVAGASNFNDLL